MSQIKGRHNLRHLLTKSWGKVRAINPLTKDGGDSDADDPNRSTGSQAYRRTSSSPRRERKCRHPFLESAALSKTYRQSLRNSKGGPAMPSPEDAAPKNQTGAPRRLLTATGRVTKACTKCRRGRRRCIQTSSAGGPCQGCVKARVEDQCVYTDRGFSKIDREYRSTPIKASSQPPPGVQTQEIVERSLALSTDMPGAFAMPAPTVIADACRAFVSSYFQLGFFNEAYLLERVDKSETSTFLMLNILAISAPFTPSLLAAHNGDASKASEHFATQSRRLVAEEMQKPTLENTQGFFLLGVYEWAHGRGQLGWIQMGIAVRMAGLLRLHRESTYDLSAEATSDQVIYAEIARRTFWLIQTHDNHLSSGSGRPTSFALYDIDVRLPCSEEEFAWGLVPSERSVLGGTGGVGSPSAASSSVERSLMASMIQGDNLFGAVAREACQAQRDGGYDLTPWAAGSRYHLLNQELLSWERTLPGRQTWSLQNLRRYQAQNLDIAFVSITSTIRLSHVILRRIHLPQIALAADLGTMPAPPPQFGTLPSSNWKLMASEMFSHAYDLFQQMEGFFQLRTLSKGCPPSIAFCVYITGDMFLYLLKYPQLCPELAGKAEHCFVTAVTILEQLPGWGMARRWCEVLRRECAEGELLAGTLTVTAMRDQDRTQLHGLYRYKEEENLETQVAQQSPDRLHESQRSPGSANSLNGTLSAPTMTSSTSMKLDNFIDELAKVVDNESANFQQDSSVYSNFATDTFTSGFVFDDHFGLDLSNFLSGEDATFEF